MSFFGALAKNGSFGFAKGNFLCRAKPNVQDVRVLKIAFKKCGVTKIKNKGALVFCSTI
jgi:hypothetical protein